MKFSIGDKIILKRTGEEGSVVGYINKEMLEVEVGGTNFPVYLEDIDHPYFKWFTEKNRNTKKASVPEQLPIEKKTEKTIRLARGIYLSFMPVFLKNDFEDVVDYLKVYLINETPVTIRYSYESSFFQQTDFKLEGTLHAFGNLYLHDISYEAMNDQPKFHWYLADANQSNLKTEEGVLRIKPSKLFERINELLLKNEATFSYLLIEDFIEKPKEIKPSKAAIVKNQVQSNSKNYISSLADIPRFEVDLHIEKIIPDFKGLSNTDIMNAQLHELRMVLDSVISKHQDRLIIIHGVGSGVLRDAVHQVLRETPEVDKFENQWMGRYGFGATEVFFKY